MEVHLREETAGLVQAWAHADPGVLQDYLVQDVEDPRINVQSLLTRHFLAELLFPGRFAALKAEELRFAAAMNWLLRLAKASPSREQLDLLLAELRDRTAGIHETAGAPGLALPSHVARTSAALPKRADGVSIPAYVRETLARWRAQPDRHALLGSDLALFQTLWFDRMAGAEAQPLTVVEPACGAANDYRFLEAFGLAWFLDYTGFDLCAANIAHARRLFPGTRFEAGNVLEIAAPDGAFEACFVHDLFEHLSLRALKRAVAEVCRVTRRVLRIHFFSMHDGPEHLVRPVRTYHWNTLSLPRTKELFLRQASAVETVHVAAFLASALDGYETHNPNGYTFTVWK
jgi:SAM-dependent methyltransferase